MQSIPSNHESYIQTNKQINVPLFYEHLTFPISISRRRIKASVARGYIILSCGYLIRSGSIFCLRLANVDLQAVDVWFNVSSFLSEYQQMKVTVYTKDNGISVL